MTGCGWKARHSHLALNTINNYKFQSIILRSNLKSRYETNNQSLKDSSGI